MDWNLIRNEYISDESSSYRKLSKKYGVSLTAITKRSKEENWIEQRERLKDETMTKIIENLSRNAAKRLERVSDLADKLLDKIEKAINELDIQILKDVEKVKTIEYKNKERPDKPTKETIKETEKIIEFDTIVDRSGLKAIASALRDIKEIQMLKSELDQREQEARIKNLERQANASDGELSEIIVTFGSEDEEVSQWAE